MTTSNVRIGELSRRVGVSTELLRAWERRYGLLRPERSSGGFRLYGREDEARVRLMQDHLGQGLSAAEAASLALAGESPAAEPTEAGSSPARHSAASSERSTSSTSSRHMPSSTTCWRASLDTILRDVLLPYLRELGERWERGEVSVAQEHYASGLLRGRLLGLARGWGRGVGPHASLPAHRASTTTWG